MLAGAAAGSLLQPIRLLRQLRLQPVLSRLCLSRELLFLFSLVAVVRVLRVNAGARGKVSSDLDDVTVTSSNNCRVNVQTDGLRRDWSRRLKGVGGPVKVPLMGIWGPEQGIAGTPPVTKGVGLRNPSSRRCHGLRADSWGPAPRSPGLAVWEVLFCYVGPK